MINYNLPIDIQIDNETYPINKNGDFRMVLDVISVLNDDEIEESEKIYTALVIFYNFNIPENAQAAANEMMRFINLGTLEEAQKQNAKPPLMSWEQDFQLLIAPTNKVLGYETRDVNTYTHWWSFVGGYQNISEECLFSKVISIRVKRQRGMKLDKDEQRFYNENRDIINLKHKLSAEEKAFLYDDED